MAKNQGKEKKNGLISTLFTVEVFGMALALLCVLVLLRLTVGDILFGQVGEEIGQFFFGVFGYLSFPLLVLLGFLGIKALLGFKVQNRAVKRFTKYFFIYALLVSLVSHTALNQIALSFEEYIDYCYQAGVTISSSTFGGVAIGSLAHFVANFLTKTGSFVVYSLLIAITTITLFRNKISQMIIASKSGEKQSKKESKKARKEKKNADAEEEPISANSFEYESSEEVEARPTRTVIFGGGAFEKKSDGDKNSSSAGVKVLFGSETFGRKSSVNNNSFAYTSPITTEKSYREKYDEDIARKTEFVRKPAESVPGRVYSPMGERATTEVPSFLSNQENTMDIDVSEPEKDIYVFNRGGKTRENISLFDKKVRESDLNTRSFESDNSNEYNRDRFTPYTESGDLNGFTTSSREEFKIEERNSFARRENPFTQEENTNSFARRENPFVQEERRDDFTRRENPFTYERQNESFERGERNSFVSTNSGENEDAMPSRTTFETRETFTERDRFNANEGRRENFNEQVSVAPDYNDENGFSSGSF
ncbi:MAG: hypothetical protein IKT32_01345, partial [Clostridia bacterium]|nr:hypothetical protein [Clostridia bacterium]